MAKNFAKISQGINFLGQSSTPTTPSSGDVYYDTTRNTFVHYINGGWSDVQSRVDVASASNLTSTQLNASAVQSTFVRITGSTAGNICGLIAAASSKQVVVYNVSSAVQTILNQSATETTAANRITTPAAANITLSANQAVVFTYDDSAATWVPTGYPGLTNPMTTAGQMIIGGVSGAPVAPSTSNLFWDNTNFRFGLGTTTPNTAVHVKGTSGAGGITIERTDASIAAANLQFRTSISGGAATTGGGISQIVANGFGATTFVTGSRITTVAAQNFTDSAAGSKMTFEISNTGSISPTTQMTIQPYGSVKAATGFHQGFTSTATAAGTTTMTETSTQTQLWTGTQAQNINLPDATKISVGDSYKIINGSTGALSIRDNGATALGNIAGGGRVTGVFTCTSNGTAAGTWVYNISGGGVYTPTNIGSNANVSSITLQVSQFIQCDNIINVSGFFNITPTASGTQTNATISLPMSNTGLTQIQLNGNAETDAGGADTKTPAFIRGDSTAHGARFEYHSPSASGSNMVYMFQYQAF